jgi:hypothetical protein
VFECPENWFLGSTRSLGPRKHSLCAIWGGSADRATYLRHEFRLGNASAIFFEKKLALLKKHSYCPGLNTELRIWVLWPEGRISYNSDCCFQHGVHNPDLFLPFAPQIFFPVQPGNKTNKACRLRHTGNTTHKLFWTISRLRSDTL